MDHILKHCCEGDDIPWEIDFFNDGGIPQEDHWRHIHRIGKPLPRKKPGDQEEGVVLHLYSHNDFEGDEEHESEGKRVSYRPEITQEATLVSYLHLLLGKNNDQIDKIVLHPSA